MRIVAQIRRQSYGRLAITVAEIQIMMRPAAQRGSRLRFHPELC